MDIAELAYSVDSSGLVQGNRALDENVRSAERATAAAEGLEDRYRRIAQQGVAYAESMRTANVSERAAAEAQRESTSALNSKTMLMARAGSESERMAERVARLQASEQRAAAATAAADRATQLRELNLRKLLGQIDPTIAKLDRLADMERRLEKARDLGAINPQVFDQYQAKLDATRAATLNVGAASDTMTKSLGSLNLQSVETQQSVAALARAVATGQWGQAQASITSLTARTGVMNAVFSAGGLAIGGTLGVLGGFALAADRGAQEARDLENALIRTGYRADATATALANMAARFDEIEGVTRGRATAALAEVTATGRMTAAQIEMVTEAALKWERATGQAIGTTIREFQRLQEDPVDAILELNAQMNFLTAETLEQIRTLKDAGQHTDAARVALEAYAGAINTRAPQMTENLGYLEQALRGIKSFGGEFVDTMKSIGRDPTSGDLTARIKQWQLDLDNLSKNDVAMRRLREGQIRGAQSQLAQLAVDAAMARAQQAAAVDSGESERRIQAGKEYDRYLARMDRELALKQEIMQIDKVYNNLAANDPRRNDGSRERLIAEAERRINQQFDRREGVNRRDPAAGIIERLQKQIALNNEQLEAEEKLTATERMLTQVRVELDRIGGKTTAGNRTLIESLIGQAKASGEAAEAERQRQKDLAANAAMVERLAELERVRREQAEIDLMGIGRGSEVTERLKRELDIQREYLQEVEKLARQQRNKNTAVSKEEYQVELELLARSRDAMLEIERRYQHQRQQLQGDWRNGFTRAWDDYVAAASDAASQSERLLTNSLAAGEDAFVRLARTGKLSFSDLADSIIADMARIAWRQAMMGMFGNLFSGMFGGLQTGNPAAGGTWGYMPGREYGGPVSKSGLYQVGERNHPELLSTPRGQYLIPGDNGRVDPIRAVQPAVRGGGMGTPQININLHGAPEGTTATARPNESGGFDMDVIVAQLDGALAQRIGSGSSQSLSALQGVLDVRKRV